MYIILSPHVRITIGVSKSIIIDFKESGFYNIPNTLAILFKKGYCKEDFSDNLALKNQEIISGYFNFLTQKRLAYKSSEIYNKWKLQNLYCQPYLIENSIIDFSLFSKFELTDVINEIDELRCPHLQIRVFQKIELPFLKQIFSNLSSKSFRSIDFYLPAELSLKETLFLFRFVKNDRRYRIYFFNSSKQRQIGNVFYTTTRIIDERSCGKIGQNNFSINKELYLLSNKSNSCLFKKISINQYGEIKNCPSMEVSFGNIKNTTIKEALSKDEFKKYWSITKDNISICKDCEFRNVCTDCRAYLQDPNDIYSKPLKCGYNPYTKVWEEWSTNPLSRKGIEYYDMRELVKEKLL